LKSIKRFKKVQSIKVANKQNAEQQSNCLSSGPSNSLEIAPIDCAQQTTLSITPNEAMSTVTAESKKQCKEGTPSNESMAEITPIDEDSLTTSLNILPETVLIESEDSEPETSSDIWIKLNNQISRGGITLYEINKHCLFDG